MTTMGADKTSEPLTVSTVELKPGEDMVTWYNRVTKIFNDYALDFQHLPADVKKYMLYGPMDCNKKVTPPKIGSDMVSIDKIRFDTIDPALADVVANMNDKHIAKHDQTIKADAGKPPLGMVPMEIVFAIAIIRQYGNNKYGDPWSWKRVAIDRYVDAALRHALAFAGDYLSVDEESKLPHLWHLACNIAFLCDMLKEELNAIYTTTRNEHQPR